MKSVSEYFKHLKKRNAISKKNSIYRHKFIPCTHKKRADYRVSSRYKKSARREREMKIKRYATAAEYERDEGLPYRIKGRNKWW